MNHCAKRSAMMAGDQIVSDDPRLNKTLTRERGSRGCARKRDWIRVRRE